MNEPKEEAWRLDKRVPIPLIVTLLVQTFLIGWWTSSIDGRVSALEKTNPSTQLINIATDLATLKERVDSTKEDVSEIKEMLTDKAKR